MSVGIRHEDVDAAEEERRRQLRLRRHHRHVQRLGGDGRDGDQIVGAQVGDGLVEQVHDHPRLPAGRDRGLLDLLDRLLPVVAEAHLARRLLHLVLAPCEFLVGERDELLGRVRNHVVAQVANQAFAAARLALDLRRVGFARRARRDGLGGVRDVGLGAPLHVEVVDLRVARERVEVERLQRRRASRVVALSGAGAAARAVLPRAAAARRRGRPPSAAAFRVEARDDVAHLVLRQRDDLGEVRDRRKFGAGAGWTGGNAGGVAGTARRRRDLVAQERRVVLQRLSSLLVRHPHPPA